MLTDAQRRKRVLKKLSTFQSAIYKSATGQSYDPNTSMNAITYAEYNVNGYQDKPTKGEIESGLVNMSSVVILIAADAIPVTPKINDLIIFSDGTFSVEKNLPVRGTESVILHRLACVTR